jgi:CRP-like cAMP-binding protein
MNITETKDEIIEGVGVAVPIAEIEARTEPVLDYSMPDCVEALRRIGVFADLPREQLEWFIENSDEREFRAGETVFRKGDEPEWMLIYLEGEVHARRDENNLDDFVYIARAGDPATEISGKLPFSRMKTMSINGRAVADTRVLLFPVALFPQLIERMPVLAERLVWLMTDRVREATKNDERRDKLMALGKLSAGLAHELNNPAAAARRTADELSHTLEELRVADLNLCRHQLSPAQREFLSDFERDAIAAASAENSTAGNALMMSDCEDELIEWLEQRDIGDGWRRFWRKRALTPKNSCTSPKRFKSPL